MAGPTRRPAQFSWYTRDLYCDVPCKLFFNKTEAKGPARNGLLPSLAGERGGGGIDDMDCDGRIVPCALMDRTACHCRI